MENNCKINSPVPSKLRFVWFIIGRAAPGIIALEFILSQFILAFSEGVLKCAFVTYPSLIYFLKLQNQEVNLTKKIVIEE